MQMAVVEFARHVLGWPDALSTELNPDTTHPMVHLMPDQNGVTDIGGTLRLGSYPCVLDKTTKAYALYGEAVIQERHRHRYEINNAYRKELQDAGLTLSGLSPDGRIVEMIELKSHPFFLATQAHPELKSGPTGPTRCSGVSWRRRWSIKRHSKQHHAVERAYVRAAALK